MWWTATSFSPFAAGADVATAAAEGAVCDAALVESEAMAEVKAEASTDGAAAEEALGWPADDEDGAADEAA